MYLHPNTPSILISVRLDHLTWGGGAGSVWSSVGCVLDPIPELGCSSYVAKGCLLSEFGELGWYQHPKIYHTLMFSVVNPL